MRGWAGLAGRADGPGSSWRLERWRSPFDVVATVLVLAVLVFLVGAALLIRERPLDRLHQHAVVEFGVEGDLDARLVCQFVRRICAAPGRGGVLPPGAG